MTHVPAPLEFKPDLPEAARRWAAYLAGEMIDRPLVCLTAPRAGRTGAPGAGYRERVFGDLEKIIDNALVSAAATYYAGEAIPTFWTSFGPDEIAVFCGSDLLWDEASEGTNWSKPIVEAWEAALPLRLHEEHPLWQRMLQLNRRAAERLAGKMILSHLDLHTNMDLLAALRGPERLCMDLVDQPEMIDRAMASARAIFPEVWRRIAEAARMDASGYCNGVYAPDGAAILQCDFICMMSPAMFRRWVLPALEEEAAMARHVFFHWDGPGALKHEADILASRGLHTLGYVPTVGPGGRIRHIEHLDLLKRAQAAGKSVQFCGTIDEVKAAHRELRPERVMYCTGAASEKEADDLLAWLVRRT